MSVTITVLPEQDDACYKLELLETQADGGEVYVCTACGYKRLFYWDNLARSHTLTCPTRDSHRHCLTIHPDWMGQDVLSIGAHLSLEGDASWVVPPSDWEPRRMTVREGILDGWLQFTIEAVETYGQPWDNIGGSCRIGGIS